MLRAAAPTANDAKRQGDLATPRTLFVPNPPSAAVWHAREGATVWGFLPDAGKQRTVGQDGVAEQEQVGGRGSGVLGDAARRVLQQRRQLVARLGVAPGAQPPPHLRAHDEGEREGTRP